MADWWACGGMTCSGNDGENEGDVEESGQEGGVVGGVTLHHSP